MYRLKKLLVFIKCINIFYQDNEEEKFKVSAKNKTNHNPPTPHPPKQQKQRKPQNKNSKKPEQRI